VAQMGCNHLKKGELIPFFFMDTYTYKVRIGTLGSVGVQATSRYHAEDKVWIGLQAGKYAPLTAKSLTRKDISVA